MSNAYYKTGITQPILRKKRRSSTKIHYRLLRSVLMVTEKMPVRKIAQFLHEEDKSVVIVDFGTYEARLACSLESNLGTWVTITPLGQSKDAFVHRMGYDPLDGDMTFAQRLELYNFLAHFARYYA